MLRYIYLLCFLINFDLVFCYSSIRSNNKDRARHSVGGRLRRRQEYVAEDSPLTNIDLVGFMQRPEAEDFDPYSYDNKRPRSKYADDTPESALRLRRRSRHEPELSDARSTARDLSPSLQLARHPKRKCSFSLFPFFSHKNKTKPASGTKHKKRKSHSARFFKGKNHGHVPSISDSIHEPMTVKSQEEIQITAATRLDETANKRKSPNCKMKMQRPKKSLPQIIHNSRQYFANHYRMNDTESPGVMRIFKNDSKRERARNDNIRYERYNEREEPTREGVRSEARAKEDLSNQQKEQQRVLEELENRLRESYHVLRNLFKK